MAILTYYILSVLRLQFHIWFNLVCLTFCQKGGSLLALLLCLSLPLVQFPLPDLALCLSQP